MASGGSNNGRKNGGSGNRSSYWNSDPIDDNEDDDNYDVCENDTSTSVKKYRQRQDENFKKHLPSDGNIKQHMAIKEKRLS